MNVRRIIAGACFLLAPIVALQAHVMAGNSAPDWAESWNGFHLAKKARTLVRAKMTSEEQLDLTVPAKAMRLARSAYESEPLAADSHFVLSLKPGVAREHILRISHSMDKRNRPVALSLLQIAANRNDLEEMMQLVDELSRLDRELRPKFVSVLSETLKDESSISILKEALKRRPSWRTEFWRLVPSDKIALEHYLLLRKEVEPERDLLAERQLIKRLIQLGMIEEAFQFYAEFKKPSIEGEDAEDAYYPPIDWQLADTRNASALLLPDQSFQLFVEGNNTGELMRKLVAIEPGIYGFTGTLINPRGTGTIVVDLVCVSGTTPPAWKEQRLDKNPTWAIPRGACPYAWLVVKGDTWDGGRNLVATLQGASFAKIR